MAETLRTQLGRRLDALEAARRPWEKLWRELADFILPYRSRFMVVAREKSSATKLNRKIVDGTATDAVRTLQSGMVTGLTSPARAWFRLAPPDPDLAEVPAVRTWLHTVETRMRDVFARSNFYNSLGTVYQDLAVFGTAVIVIDEDEQRTIHCTVLPVGSYYLAADHAGRVNGLFRKYSMTVGQMVRRFGLEACSQTVRSLHQNGTLDALVEISHAIVPNDEVDVSRADWRGMPWLSVRWETGSESERVLEVKGYREFPVMAPRWDVTGEDVYGYGPGLVALPDVKQLQQEQRRKAEIVDKLARPPLVAPSTLRNSSIDLLPGGITFVDVASGMQGLQPAYQVSPQIQPILYDIERLTDKIRRAFYADLFLMLAQAGKGEMTAREVQERHEEKLLALGPVIERLNSDLLDRVIDRTFQVMLRAGLVPPPPEELQGQELKTEYISLLAQAQKLVGTVAIEQLVGFVGGIASLKPDVVDKVDLDQAVDEYAQMVGTSPRVVRADEDVAELREARQQAQAAAQMAQGVPQMAKAAKDAAEAREGEGSILDRVLAIGRPPA